ncbi:hypothetical protein BBJ28_00015294 [Nothophytophthora sp. Chile5]|nr:hypothetical protein BBJ28_00015294 [Nothophytophthora sp. Chile5]
MTWAFVAVALGLMLLKMGAWLAVVRPHSDLWLNVVYVVATVLMLWSYGAAMFSTPTGRRPIDERAERDADQAPVTRYCERCDCEKTASVHHCSVCKRCVFRMDHHCPWTNNCVGWSNKKLFLLFLVYTSLSCLVFNAMASPLAWSLSGPPHWLLKAAWALSLGIGLLLAGYFVFHVWLLRQGKTTLEFLSGKRGELTGCSLRHNATVYFGRDVWNWWLPVTPALDPAMGGRRHHEQEPEMLQLVVE